MKRYIYQVIGDASLLHDCQRRLSELLNEMADQGWEHYANANYSGYPVLYFRKPIEESHERERILRRGQAGVDPQLQPTRKSRKGKR